MRRIQITYEAPTHGWLPIRFVIDGETIDIIASNVSNDPVQGLVEALDAVARGYETHVFWPLEPGGYFFFFAPIEDRVQLRVRFAENDDVRSKPVLSIEGDRSEILLPLWRFIRNFQSHGYPKPHWPTIDGRHMASIKAALRKQP
jgi:hypothetical protein